MRCFAVLALLLFAPLSGCLTGPEPHGDPPPFDEAQDDEVSVLATGFDTIWEIAFSPDGRVFLTERPGRIVVMDEASGFEGRVWADVDVAERGESGLMGLALHPQFPDEPYVYVSYTTQVDGRTVNRVSRWIEEDGSGREDMVLIDDMAAASIHDGSRIGFGPRGMLWVTMGDAGNPSSAQDEDSPNGKVLRVGPAGGVPADNPRSGSYIYTMGHRNPQGLDFHPETDEAYITEHGPENHDEINLLRAGANYGWPTVRGPDTGGGAYEPSLWTSGSGGTIAPAGAAFIDAPGSPLHGSLAFGTLRARHLHVVAFDDEHRPVDEHVLMQDQWGRIRAVTWGPDDALYLGTSNRDGRGNAGPDDDRVVRVPLAALEAMAGAAG